MVSVWFYLVGATYLNVEAVHPSIPLQPHVKRLFWIRSITRTNPKRNQYCLFCSLQTFERLLDRATVAVMDNVYSRSSCFSWHYWCCFIQDGYGEGCVPIYPKTEYWETVDENKKITPHSGTMIPLWLIYAWTIWKAQGQTIKSKVVVVIGQQKESTGWHTLLCQARWEPVILG